MLQQKKTNEDWARNCWVYERNSYERKNEILRNKRSKEQNQKNTNGKILDRIIQVDNIH